MILHALAERGQPGHPWLVFLHGFSGDCRESMADGRPGVWRVFASLY
ncbi:acyl-CoA thioester hydrolase [Klebsiella michiganensis]|nr:acyl-CoA thioester hydrolase [Klebsiella michiganensis]